MINETNISYNGKEVNKMPYVILTVGICIGFAGYCQYLYKKNKNNGGL